ncbi:hypothetical protein B0T21DRAFT_94750 [Apiosordaria backusii]|uniref:Uncharacterized protein n=1 Tax=Apiosordaria backusii TaxID=314023 RepID=A0AA40ESX1_9PEZI|nr:hypothetical protein B0T21DRAFT_94750 [Apiosordaria backusii]
MVGGMPMDYVLLWLVWRPKFKPQLSSRLVMARSHECVPVMCLNETGGAYWCNDSDDIKKKPWRDLAEIAGKVFYECTIGIRTAGQTQVDKESRLIVTNPLGSGCRMRYNDTLETPRPFNGTWPEDLEEDWRTHVAHHKHGKRQVAPSPTVKPYPLPAMPGPLTSPVPGPLTSPVPEVSRPHFLVTGAHEDVSRPSYFECSSVIGRPPTFSHARRLFSDAMGEFKGGKKCTLGPKQCMAVGCHGETAAFFWCNDSMEIRTKPCYDPVLDAWDVVTHCKGEFYGKNALTGGTVHNGDERVFVVRPIDGRCELEYERTERKFDDGG